ncbi:nicotinate (nicotinamide) nucleotide adenylyltransferase [Aureivirga marina]|uniref:nicotinate (nicotinamide) nucleotide adenylyltransferase n=1 Tax=Aureivirga marina TaxID=1182451 RepID=UPI0018CB63A0|nr:nicotinate (nicotinamide) nucleotide adenylyltransferase [Aureivirga marina]
MKIGLYFGTFNPIHIGHIIIANHMQQYSDLDEVWMVVTPHNPLKKKSTLLDNHHRLEMVYKALEDYPHLKVSDIEFKLPQPNYTINTLVHIQEKFPSHDFSIIMGEDNLNTFHKWKNYDEILNNHHIYVYPRIDHNEIKEEFVNHSKIHKIDAPIVQISSTFVRNSVKENKNILPLVPKKVWEYIDLMNFYK